ncbi:MAG: fibronectin type III domain-containing protein [Candidatus Omnitrophica bacterium]|nr:fibronectin type III domain-containing protein [Candidatus Omnitrophota bacterium]
MSQQDRIKPNKKLILGGLVLFFCLFTRVAATAYAAPNAPSNLTAAVLSTTEIRLYWQDNSSDESGFKIERSSSLSGPFSQIGAMVANSTTCRNYGLTPGTTYYYRVRAYNSAGNSGYTNVVNATTASLNLPATPSNLTATTLSTTEIRLYWQDNSSNETGFKIENSSSASGPFSQIGAMVANSTTCRNYGLTPNTTYYYRICAYNAYGNSGYSNVVSGTTIVVSNQPPTITTQPVSQIVNIGISVSFSLTATGTAPLTYQWQKKASAVGAFTNISGAINYIYTFTPIASDNGTQFRCIVTNSVGSATSNSAGLTVNVTLTVNAQNGTVTRSPLGTQVTGGYLYPASTVVTLTATPNVGYLFTTWSGGVTGSTNPVNITLDGNKTVTANFSLQVQIPAAPSNLTATVSNTKITLSWQDNSNNETGFIIERGIGSSSQFFFKIGTTSANVTTYVDSGGINSTYYYRIRAQNTYGYSSYSNIVSAKTASASNSPPTVGSVSPSSSSCTVNGSINLTTTYSDADGWQDIQSAYLLVNTSTNGSNCFYGYYNRNTNQLYLGNDANSTWLGGFIPGSANSIENSYAKLDCSQTTVSGSGTTLTIKWSLILKDAFFGIRNIYLYVADNSGATNTGGLAQKGDVCIFKTPIAPPN